MGIGPRSPEQPPWYPRGDFPAASAGLLVDRPELTVALHLHLPLIVLAPRWDLFDAAPWIFARAHEHVVGLVGLGLAFLWLAHPNMTPRVVCCRSCHPCSSFAGSSGPASPETGPADGA